MTALSDAVVLITGAGGGFGRELVRQCARKGARIIATDRDEDALAKAAGDADGRLLAAIPADLSNGDGCSALHAAAEAVASPDILVNNAGLGLYGRLDETSPEQWELVLTVNLLAPMRLAALCSPAMIRRGHGHILNVSSIAGWTAVRGMTAYSASKFGLRGFGEALADELVPLGVQVTNVYPFFSRTPIIDSPQIGSLPRMRPTEKMMTRPADIVARMLTGIERNQRHVFPDAMSWQIQFLKRHFPRLLDALNRLMERRLRVDAAAD